MIENEFLFLGLLADGPKHGYEIKRQVQQDLGPETGLRIKSFYYPLTQMEKQGLITKYTGREGKFPQKQVYQITPKGRAKFDKLMEQSLVSIERPFFQIDLSLYFLHLADKMSAKRRLRARLTLLRRISKEVSALHEKSNTDTAPVRLIYQHNLDLINAEILSTAKLIEKI